MDQWVGFSQATATRVNYTIIHLIPPFMVGEHDSSIVNYLMFPFSWVCNTMPERSAAQLILLEMSSLYFFSSNKNTAWLSGLFLCYVGHACVKSPFPVAGRCLACRAAGLTAAARGSSLPSTGRPPGHTPEPPRAACSSA